MKHLLQNAFKKLKSAALPILLLAAVFSLSDAKGSGKENLLTDLTYNTEPVSVGNILQGTNNNPIYILKIDAVSDVYVNNIELKTSGTFDNDDISYFLP